MNKENQTKIIRYLKKITGQDFTLIPLSKTEKGNVPVYLLEIYGLFHLNLFNRKLIIAVIRNEDGKFTPTEYATHIDQLQQELKGNVSLVLFHIKAYERNRLIKKTVPFIVPDRQLFLPQFTIDLKEYYPRKKHPLRETLSYPAQLVVIYHLIKENIELYSLRQLADKIGYSPMTLSNVADELSGFNICEVIRSGRKKIIRFQSGEKKLWKNAAPYLKTPVHSHRWVHDTGHQTLLTKAGITALSNYTQISDDSIPTYALWKKEYRKMLQTEGFTECHGPDEATARIELWFYSPELLVNNNIVDKLSLYLSLQDSPDERVIKSLHKMLGEIKW